MNKAYFPYGDMLVIAEYTKLEKVNEKYNLPVKVSIADLTDNSFSLRELIQKRKYEILETYEGISISKYQEDFMRWFGIPTDKTYHRSSFSFITNPNEYEESLRTDSNGFDFLSDTLKQFLQKKLEEFSGTFKTEGWSLYPKRNIVIKINSKSKQENFHRIDLEAYIFKKYYPVMNKLEVLYEEVTLTYPDSFDVANILLDDLLFNFKDYEANCTIQQEGVIKAKPSALSVFSLKDQEGIKLLSKIMGENLDIIVKEILQR